MPDLVEKFSLFLHLIRIIWLIGIILSSNCYDFKIQVANPIRFYWNQQIFVHSVGMFVISNFYVPEWYIICDIFLEKWNRLWIFFISFFEVETVLGVATCVKLYVAKSRFSNCGTKSGQTQTNRNIIKCLLRSLNNERLNWRNLLDSVKN